MAKHKLSIIQPGDIVNGYKLIERTQQKNGRWYANFLCPHCDTIFEAKLQQVNVGESKCKCQHDYSTYGRKDYKKIGKGHGSIEYKTHRHIVNPGSNKTVCEDWLGDSGFVNFYRDMGDRPSKEHRLRRLDENLPYSKENCKWMTNAEYNYVDLRTPKHTIFGEEITSQEAADKYEVGVASLWAAYKKGISLETYIFERMLQRDRLEIKNNYNIRELVSKMRRKTINWAKWKTCRNNNKNFIEIIGCSQDELRVYLQSKFTEGMSWDNWGTHGWHIDHIIPIGSALTEKEVLRLSHYTNLQPLWAIDNLRKGDRF